MNTREIARLAKVSPATVSRALQNSSSVKKETKELIFKIAREEDYYPEKNKAGVKPHKSNVIGLLIPREAEEKFIYHNTNFYSTIFTGFKEEIDKCQGQTLIISYRNNKLSEDIKLIDKKDLKALAIIHTTETDDEFIIKNKDSFPIPFLVINREFKNTQISCVRTDEAEGGYMAASHLYELGHKRICCLGLWQELFYLKERIRGYERLVKEKSGHIIKSDIVKCFCPEDSYVLMKELLKKQKDITGIFLTEEELAPGVLKALEEADKEVPKDVSIVSYNDYGFSLRTNPQLTTIRLPSKEIGRLAGQVVRNLIEIKESQLYDIVLKPKLIERHSCTPV